MDMNPLGCHCPGVEFYSGFWTELGYAEDVAQERDRHWDMWARGDLGGEEPLATQEDGLCDSCGGREEPLYRTCKQRGQEMKSFLQRRYR